MRAFVVRTDKPDKNCRKTWQHADVADADGAWVENATPVSIIISILHQHVSRGRIYECVFSVVGVRLSEWWLETTPIHAENRYQFNYNINHGSLIWSSFYLTWSRPCSWARAEHKSNYKLLTHTHGEQLTNCCGMHYSTRSTHTYHTLL